VESFGKNAVHNAQSNCTHSVFIKVRNQAPPRRMRVAHPAVAFVQAWMARAVGPLPSLSSTRARGLHRSAFSCWASVSFDMFRYFGLGPT